MLIMENANVMRSKAKTLKVAGGSMRMSEKALVSNIYLKVGETVCLDGFCNLIFFLLALSPGLLFPITLKLFLRVLLTNTVTHRWVPGTAYICY